MSFKYFYIFTFVLLTFGAKAQQDVQFSDYKLNMSSFNPAFAGFFDGSILLIHRTQFTGVDGAPTSQNLNVNLPINDKMGAGLNVTTETLGVTDETIVTGDYSYSIFLNDDDMISFGLKAGFSVLNVDYSRLDLDDPTDGSFANNIENQFSPRIGAGVLLTTKVFFLGVSTTNFIKETYNPTVSDYSVTTTPHLYMTTGFQTALTEDLTLKPSILSRVVKGAPVALDIAANFAYQDKFRFGVSYRWDAAITGVVGISFLRDFQAGYAYDYSITELGKYAPSSHQFYLKYVFKRPEDRRRECNCSFTDGASGMEL